VRGSGATTPPVPSHSPHDRRVVRKRSRKAARRCRGSAGTWGGQDTNDCSGELGGRHTLPPVGREQGGVQGTTTAGLCDRTHTAEGRRGV
jgi:hypothetical protein